jgi:DHA2 family methylenomycin A resistance protein-like MFS transporter
VTIPAARAAGTAPAAGAGTARLALTAALLGFFVIGLDASAVNVALPAIGHDLSGAGAGAGGSGGGTTTGLQWIVDAYTLSFAALLLSAGALSDRFGASRVFGAGLAVFTVMSAACGLAPGLGALVGARFAQGAAAAVMLPSSLALVRQAYPEARARGRALALWTMGGAVSSAAGPVLGGALTSGLGWQSIFYLNVPVGAVTLALLTRLPGSPRRAASFDPLGQLTAAIALSGLTYGVIEGGAHGFAHPAPLAALAVALLAGTAFAVVEARVADPMVPLGLFRSRTVSVSMVVGFTVNAAFYGSVFAFSLYFQRQLGLSPARTGLLFLPMAGVVAFANAASARAAARWGVRMPIAAGQLVGVVGLGAAAWLAGPHAHPLAVALVMVPIGVGLGFTVPSLTAAMLGDVSAERAGMAAGVLNAGRQTGGALAVAVFGALLADPAWFTVGLRVSLLAAGALLLVTSAGAAVLLPRRGARRHR